MAMRAGEREVLESIMRSYRLDSILHVMAEIEEEPRLRNVLSHFAYLVALIMR